MEFKARCGALKSLPERIKTQYLGFDGTFDTYSKHTGSGPNAEQYGYHKCYFLVAPKSFMRAAREDWQIRLYWRNNDYA